MRELSFDIGKGIEMKKTFLWAIVASVCCSMYAQSASIINEESIRISGNAVSITIPSEYSGVSSQEEADMIVSQGQAVSAVYNPDGSITYVMTDEMHRVFVDSVGKMIGSAMDSTVADTVFGDTITDISADETFTIFDIRTSLSELGDEESVLVDSVIRWGDFYSLCRGEERTVIQINFWNDESGSLIDTIYSESDQSLSDGAERITDDEDKGTEADKNMETAPDTVTGVEADADHQNSVSSERTIVLSDEFVIQQLQKIDTIVDIGAVTEEHDPNGQMNKAGGYIGCIYFRDARIDDSQIFTEGDVIDIGTEGGGAVEIFRTVEDANRRDQYLGVFDGTVLSTGSHQVMWTSVIRTSDHFTATQQRKLTEDIIALFSEEDVTYEPTAYTEDTSEDQQSTTSVETEPLIAPADEFVMRRLRQIDSIIEVAAATEDHDPMGQLNKSKSYIGCIFFADSRVDKNQIYATSDDIIDIGTKAGGSIEIYRNAEDAHKRDEYLELYDGTIIGGASHQVAGSCVVRTSELLTASQQTQLTNAIINVLTGEEDKMIYHDSETVREVQTRLNALGYDCGPADGIAGENTRSKILQYKKDHGLEENTDITEELLTMLSEED